MTTRWRSVTDAQSLVTGQVAGSTPVASANASSSKGRTSAFGAGRLGLSPSEAAMTSAILQERSMNTKRAFYVNTPIGHGCIFCGDPNRNHKPDCPEAINAQKRAKEQMEKIVKLLKPLKRLPKTRPYEVNEVKVTAENVTGAIRKYLLTHPQYLPKTDGKYTFEFIVIRRRRLKRKR